MYCLSFGLFFDKYSAHEFVARDEEPKCRGVHQNIPTAHYKYNNIMLVVSLCDL